LDTPMEILRQVWHDFLRIEVSNLASSKAISECASERNGTRNKLVLLSSIAAAFTTGEFYIIQSVSSKFKAAATRKMKDTYACC
jgi:hypothetical protein